MTGKTHLGAQRNGLLQAHRQVSNIRRPELSRARASMSDTDREAGK